jgi:hypothetical protein
VNVWVLRTYGQFLLQCSHLCSCLKNRELCFLWTKISFKFFFLALFNFSCMFAIIVLNLCFITLRLLMRFGFSFIWLQSPLMRHKLLKSAYGAIIQCLFFHTNIPIFWLNRFKHVNEWMLFNFKWLLAQLYRGNTILICLWDGAVRCFITLRLLMLFGFSFIWLQSPLMRHKLLKSAYGAIIQCLYVPKLLDRCHCWCIKPQILAFRREKQPRPWSW